MPREQTHTRVREVREQRGLSAAELARRVAVTRQSIYAIEDGSFVPNTAVALRLARVLGASVEDLFALDQPARTETVEAELLTTKAGDVSEGQPVRLCRVNERLLAAPVSFLPSYLPKADGIVEQKSRRRISVRPAMDPSNRQTLLLAGCDPALSLWTEALGNSRLEVVTVSCSSHCALEWLKRGLVHMAGSHLVDKSSGEYNVPLIKDLFPKRDVRVVTFAVWEQGLVLARGNPKGIQSVSDLASRRVRLVNREKGSGSRDLLDKALRSEGIAAKKVIGYERVAAGHLAAAHAVATGSADCCIATRSAARHFGLDFVPLTVERFDLCFPKSSFELPAMSMLLDVLNLSSFRKTLETIAGYDTRHTGEVLV